jgi:hypothetical protein
LSFSVSRLIRSALMPWHDEHQQGVGLACSIWDLLIFFSNLPGICYYDVTMQDAKSNPTVHMNPWEHDCYLLHPRAWISSRECSRRALSLPAMNNWNHLGPRGLLGNLHQWPWSNQILA